LYFCLFLNWLIQFVGATQQSEHKMASCDSIAANRSWQNEGHQCNTIHAHRRAAISDYTIEESMDI